MPARSSVATRRAAKRLAQGAGDNIDAIGHAAKFRRAATVRTNDAHCVRIVDHDQRLILIGQRADSFQVCDRAIHREHAVSRDPLIPRAIGIGQLQLRLQIGHVGMTIAITLRFAQTYTIDNAGVIERIADDRVVLPQQRFEQTTVGIKTRAVEDGVLQPKKGRNCRFKIAMDGLRAANEAHRRHAETVFIEATFGGVNQARIVSQAEIIIGAKIDDFAARFKSQQGTLRGRDQSFALIKAVIANLSGRGFNLPVKSMSHCGS